MNENKMSRWPLILLVVIAMILGPQELMAQRITVSGTVTDTQGVPLPGVGILIKGTTTGVTTDMTGKYTITAPGSESVLIFQFIGYATVEEPVQGRSTINMTLEEQVRALDEVVVTALGIRSEKKALGYAMTEVSSDDIVAVKSSNFVNSLNGKIAGVQISSPSSQQGSGTRIVIRGGSSITGNNQPLFVVNGVPFDAANGGQSSGLADIDPNSIETVSVLKGAAASALYGSNAANGVILITTKSGSFNSAPRVTFSHTSSFDKIWEIPLQETWAQGSIVGGVPTYNSTASTSWGPRIADTPGLEYYDRWQVFKTGYTMENSFNVTGGTNQTSYFVAVSDYNNDGILSKLGFKRTSLTGNTTFRFTEKLSVSTNFTYTKQTGNRLFESIDNSAFMNTLMAAPANWNPYPIYDENGVLRLFRSGGRNPYLFTLNNSGRTIARNRTLGNIIVEYKILPSLTFRSVSGVSTTNYKYEDYFNKGGYQIQNGYFSASTSFSRDIESTNLLTFNKAFSDFDVTVMAGQNIVDNYWEGMSFDGEGLVLPGVYNAANVSSYTADTYKGQYRSWSVFGEARIAYKSMLYYTFTERHDRVSSLSNFFFYPSHSLGFIFSELVDLPALTFGKLRASYAKVGSPAGAYATNIVLAGAGGFGVTWPFNSMASYLPSSTFPNPDLTNEFKNEVEIGADLRFFNNRLGLDIAYYNNWSTNQIVWQSLLASTGFTGGNINIGNIEHNGIELGISGTPVKTPNFTWDVILNWSKDNSNVVKLGEYDEPVSVGSSGTAIVGQPYPVFYGTGFLRDDQGRLVLDDRNPASSAYGRPMVDGRGSKILGKMAPDWVGSFRNTVSYKSLSLIAQFDFQKGGLVYSQNDHYLTYYGMAKHQEDRPEDDMITFDGVMGHYDAATQQVVISSETPVPTRYSLYFQNVCQQVDEENLMPKDYIKLRELILSYEVPASILGKTPVKGLRIAFSGRNLWNRFHKDFYDIDPEINTNGIDNGNGYVTYSFPSLKTYSFTLNATF
ncbi:MAG: SusC/RagA family TonB-linked outer membrane protein [Bacteroidales bacterium]|nr:SusC/RagA family TonB-linked outer membrane protein [Bacteroidales bacterium]